MLWSMIYHYISCLCGQQFPSCYRLNVCATNPKFILNPNPQGDGVRRGPLGGDEVMRVGPPCWDQCPHNRDIRAPSPSPTWGHSKKTPSVNQEEASADTKSASTLISHFCLQNWDNWQQCLEIFYFSLRLSRQLLPSKVSSWTSRCLIGPLQEGHVSAPFVGTAGRGECPMWHRGPDLLSAVLRGCCVMTRHLIPSLPPTEWSRLRWRRVPEDGLPRASGTVL